jgi:type I restriction enzyme S subunit
MCLKDKLGGLIDVLEDNNSIHEGFKETELGPLPEEWKVVRLGDVVNLVMGQSPPGSTYNEIGDGMPFLQGKAKFSSLYPKHVKYTTKPLKIWPKGSILISVRAPVGDVNVANLDYCIGRGLASISLYEGDNTFLFHLLTHLKSNLEKEGTGSTFKAINKTKLLDFKIPLPPLPEQRAIANVLSTVQEAKERTDAVITATKEFKKSLMKHLFTYGHVSLEEAENVPLKETEIGMVPEEWEIENLDRYCNFTTGKLNSNQAVPNGKYPFFTCSPETYRIDRSSFDCEAVLLAGNNARGIYSVKYYNGKFDAYQRTYVITIKDLQSLDYKYLKNALETRLEELRISSIGTSTKFLTLKILNKLKIPLPPLSTQRKIAEILSSIDKKIEAEENKKKALEELFKSLLNNLMTGKLRANGLKSLVS